MINYFTLIVQQGDLVGFKKGMTLFTFTNYPIKPLAPLPPLRTKNFQKTIKHLRTFSSQMSNIDKLVFCNNSHFVLTTLKKMIQLLIPLSDLLLYGAHSRYSTVGLRSMFVFSLMSVKMFYVFKKTCNTSLN